MEFPERYKNLGISRQDYWRTVAKFEKMPFLENIPALSPEVLLILPKVRVLRLRSIPFYLSEQGVGIAIDDPLDYDLRDCLKHEVTRPITFHLTLPEEIDETLLKYYKKRS